jgi:hypothetical protein
MAESGVTEQSLKTSLMDKIGAIHVEIEDMSGSYPAMPRQSLFPYLSFPVLAFCPRRFVLLLQHETFRLFITLSKTWLIMTLTQVVVAKLSAR